MGAVYVDSVPKNARAISTHYSPELVDVLKVLLCYSNNFMAERLGDMIGGAQGVARIVNSELGTGGGEVRLASTSGLGTNRVTPPRSTGTCSISRSARPEASTRRTASPSRSLRTGFRT